MPFARKRVPGELGKVLRIPVRAILPNPNQPRTHFDPQALEELAASIQVHGILQPLTVRPLSNGSYELISGERRLRAAGLVGLTHVPCILQEASDLESSLLALIENLQRRDLDF
ncbi:MAG: ParB/RepB/Spo0J family partition protein, partial [Oscillospiraceae bacterium]|nr:ParB/RepB/Spo0J family partition protein [Oscillospiraceae bacterium]